MEIQVAAKDLAELISEALRSNLEHLDDKFIFKYPRWDDVPDFELSISRLEELITSLSSKDGVDGTTLYSPNYYEVMVRDQSPFSSPILFRQEEVVQIDHDNGLTYTLSPASDEYLIFLLIQVAQIASVRAVWRSWSPRMMRLRENEMTDVFHLLRRTIPRLLTLRLETDRNKSIENFVKHADAFLFQISYNLDTALVPQRYLDELVRASRIARGRRADIDELEAPKRYYIPDIVYHYQMGVSTESPPLEYLSYYHVAEHFFEAIFSDDLIDQVQQAITQPDFSYKRKRDIKSLINDITKRVKIRDETVTFSELEALRLTLYKYIDLGILKDKLDTYDETLLDYYRDNTVSFSNGDKVDFQDGDAERIFRAISQRVYKTRNAIVHSKEGEKGKYIPFRHDRTLLKEIPLIRFIAEQIIIETSSLVR